MRTARQPLMALVMGCALFGCARHAPPHHPVGEMHARATAKLDVVELVVFDPARAREVRRVYEDLAALGREFDLARARSMWEARSAWQKRYTELADGRGASSNDLEPILVPPLEQGKALFDRYTTLMLEARRLLTEDEFAKLSAAR